MAKFITKFPLSHFEELVPLLMRCFPEFWEARLARGMRSFPYDLRLFTAKLDGRIIGSVGIHDYQFLCGGYVTSCGGLCDVSVDPDFRGRGYARELQNFALECCRKNYYPNCPMMPLYTDKPDVYTRMGWKLYESDRSTEIRTEDFPKKNAFRLDDATLSMAYRNGKKAPETEGERLADIIRRIYHNGRRFDGKCMRSGKIWLELFANPEHEWVLEEGTYFLYRKERLLEAYSMEPGHPVSRFTPAHGGHDSNKLMVNLQDGGNKNMQAVIDAIEAGKLIFPASDTF